MVRALRKWMRHTDTQTIGGLEPVDLELLTGDFVTPEPWYPYDQYLRLMQVSFDILCRGDWTTLRDYCSRGVAPVYQLGYDRLLIPGDPATTMAAVSVLWRSCHSFATAEARCDAGGVTVSVIDYPDVGELDGNVNAGWFIGMARCAGAEITGVELRRRPWRGEGNEQVVRLEWRLPSIMAEDSQTAGLDPRPFAAARTG